MTLIKSISGIRGTIGNSEDKYFSPVEIAKFASAYGTFIRTVSKKERPKVIIGRDARISGIMVNNIISGSIIGCGIDVIDIGLTSTPTVEIAVIEEKADGGVIITASHNPMQWNALKLLNSKGEFLSMNDGNKVLQIAEQQNFHFADVFNLGKITFNNNYTQIHINKILEIKLVDIDAIKKSGFTVVIDCINSVGGICLPPLLKALGVKEIIELNAFPDGIFSHNPEPLPENLEEISREIIKHKADLGFAVDPDVDRLAIINEDGSMFGEEYTLVAVSDYILMNRNGSTVSNMSSTQALSVITEKHGGRYYSSAVGEVNVVEEMKKNNAVIGGEGNGGIIFPELHYGRDALVGIALFLTHLAKSGKKCSELRKTYPEFFISKNKIQLTPNIDVDEILVKIKEKYKDSKVSVIDGVRITFENEWIHLRKSNTEPIIRIYSESDTKVKADRLSEKIINEILEIIKN
jgi:phosphomannomutase